MDDDHVDETVEGGLDEEKIHDDLSEISENDENVDSEEGMQEDVGDDEVGGEQAGQGSSAREKATDKAGEKAEEEFKNSKAGQKLDEEKAKAKEKFDNSAVGKKVNDTKDKVEDKIKEKTGLDKVTVPTSPKKAEEKAKKELKKKVKEKATQELAKKGVTKAAIMPILGAVGGFLLFLIVIVGVVMFFVAMPGQVISKLKDLGTALTEKISALIQGEEDVIYMSDMAEVANYLENMGYDLRGEGFITSDRDSAYNLEDEDASSWGTTYYYEESDQYTFDEDQYVWRNIETDEIVALNSDPIQAYIVSDNLCYIIKNFNQNLDEATGGLSGVVVAITVFVGVALAVIFSPLIAIVAVAGAALLFATASNPNWGTGLISIYHEGDSGIGSKGKAYDVKEHGYIELDIETKTLTIKRGWSNNAYTYDVDGWSGRYGMPLEFLLSVHVATQMPDLAIDMATSFDTDVLVLLREVDNGTIEAGYKLNNGTILSFTEIKELMQDSFWEQLFNNGNVTAEEFIELAKVGFPHADNCTCCTHIPGSTYTAQDDEGNPIEESCEDEETEDNWDAHTVCKACIEQAEDIVKAMKAVADKDWDTYTPYISQVTNHWFRDVYFVISDLSTEVTEVDEDYFYETNERWTLYETYEEGDDIPEGFEVGDYKYYEYDNGTYTLSTRTKEEVEALEEALTNGEDVVRLVKKPTTTLMTANNGSIWSAYEDNDEDTVSDWEVLEISDDSPSSLQEFKDQDVIYYRETRPGDLTQVEDGQRGVTNDTIKSMFVNNYYYQYDGTTTRADAIEENREALSSKYSNSDELQEAFQETMSNGVDEDGDGVDDNTGVNSSLISKVSIAKDSLNAFSMLENTHTVDADYIYRDFKELIVELNYFDKEDLSDKISEVMQWILPDTGSSGWPIREYEKGETFYGTLINSAVDIELMKNADIEAAEELLSSLKEENETTESSSTASSVTSSSTTSTVSSVSALVEKGYEVHKIMSDDGDWDYCVYNRDDSTQVMCTHTYGHSCMLCATIEEAEATTNYHNTCCATFVSWVLKAAGIDMSECANMNSAQEVYNWSVAQGWTVITNASEIESGDLVFMYGDNDQDIGHVQMAGDEMSSGTFQWLNGGSVDSINADLSDTTQKVYAISDDDFIIATRSNLSGAVENFEGYGPEEDVVSPVTGKIVDYGEVTRTNEETGEEETVEYIKIEAINTNLYNEAGDGYTTCDEETDTFDDLASDEDKNYEGYDYFYEEYQGVIDGFVVYIEGIELTIDEILESGNTDEVVSRYESNSVENMTDNVKEAQAIWKEDAKASALPLIQIGDDWYIKEGTVIGITYEDPEITEDMVTTTTNSDGEEESTSSGNGNYIRIIMRDLEDAIIEDVEEYFDIVDVLTYTGSALNAQNLDLDPELEALIEELAGPLESEYPGIVNILKAISMNESSGGKNDAAGDDPMQAVESTGGSAGDSIGGWEASVTAAINALTSAWDKANEYGISDLRVVIQAYNYGSGFVDYVHNNGSGIYTKEIAEEYSTYMANKQGWSSYGDPDYVDPKIYNYLPDLEV